MPIFKPGRALARTGFQVHEQPSCGGQDDIIFACVKHA